MRIASEATARSRARLKRLLSNGFIRNVGALAGGTAAAQALGILVLPLLTRLYSPADFNVLAVFTSILAIVSISACLRLEIAVPMPKCDNDAVNLLALSVVISTVVAIFLTLIVYIFPDQIVHMLRQPALRSYLCMLPLGIWSISLYSSVQFWAVRKHNFNAIAKTRLTQAIGGAGAQVALGYAGFAPLGLLLGRIIISGTGVLGLGRAVLSDDRKLLKSISLGDMRRMFQEYDRFPKYSSLDALTNTAGIQLPLVLIAALAAAPEAGFLMLAMRTMQAPMALIGRSVSQVYLSRAPKAYRENRLRSLTMNVLSGLAKTGIGPFIFAGFVAPPVFSIIFGAEWLRAGQLVSWMTPWLIFQFLSSPISMVMQVRNLQKAMLVVTASGLLIRLGAVLFATRYADHYLPEFYAVSGGVFYFGCYCVFSCAAGISFSGAMRIFRQIMLVSVAWGLLGYACRLLLVSLS